MAKRRRAGLQRVRTNSANEDLNLTLIMDLPLEILLLIAEIAAWDESWDTKGWVADLTLVCRAFKTVVDPILYHCVQINDKNHMHLASAAAAGVQGFATTRQVVVWVYLYMMQTPSVFGVLAQMFAHVPYVAGRPTATMWLLNERPAPRPRALSITSLPHASWFEDPNDVLRASALTHLHISFEADIWAIGGRPAPRMFQDLKALTHLALDVSADDEAPVNIYDTYAPCLPRPLQRFLFRTRGVGDPLEFGRLLSTIAHERQDRRLWLDERPVTAGLSLLQSNLEDVRMELALWNQGFQLYNPPSTGL